MTDQTYYLALGVRWHPERSGKVSERAGTGECPSFTWQPSLVTAAEDRCEVQVPMMPWGTRQLRTTAFNFQYPRMVFEPSEPVITGSAHTNYVMSGTFRIYQGQFSLRLVNRLPVQMTECHGVIGATARLT